MKRKTLLVCFLSSTFLLAAFSMMTSGASSESADVHLKGVRAQYVDLSGNRWHMDTTCHIINSSATTALVLQSIQILGPDGRQDLIATYEGLHGTVVQPLGELRLAIDSSIPGVVPQIRVGDPGVRNIIVGWQGPAAALNLTAVIERYPPSSVDDRVHVAVDGYDVTF